MSGLVPRTDAVIDPQVVRGNLTRGIEAIRAAGPESATNAARIAPMKAAIERIDAGTYGKCERCGGDIGFAILNATPTAPRCKPCQENPPSLIDRARAAIETGEARAASQTNGRDKQFADLPIHPELRGGAQMQTLPVDQIVPGDDNDRTEVGDVSDLAASIAAAGLINPVTVASNGADTYILIAGHRRLEACKTHLGWKEIPVQVFDLNPAEIAIARLVENVQREDLRPIEEARALRRLVDEHGLSQRELADKVGRSQSHISKRISLLDLPAGAIEALDSGGITIEGAKDLLKLKDHPKALEETWKEVNRYREEGEPLDQALEGEVHRALRDIEQTEKRAKLEKDLKAKGVPVLKKRPGYNDKDAKVIGRYDLNVSAKKHESEPCHAVFIDDYSGKAKPVCTEPKRHNARGASDLKRIADGSLTPGMSKEQREKQEAIRARQALIQEAADRRGAFAKDLIAAGKLAYDDSAQLLLSRLTSLAGYEEIYMEASDLPAWLGLKGGGGPKPVAKFATGPSARAKVLAAIAIREMEFALDIAENDEWQNHRYYLDLLVKHGYQLTEIETELLETKASASK